MLYVPCYDMLHVRSSQLQVINADESQKIFRKQINTEHHWKYYCFHLWRVILTVWIFVKLASCSLTNVLKINLVIIIYGVHKEGDKGEESRNFRQFCRWLRIIFLGDGIILILWTSTYTKRKSLFDIINTLF